jgi:hypothetical protein
MGEKLQPRGGAEKRTAEEVARLTEVKCGAEVSDTGYGLRARGIDRSNRETELKRIENRWR